MIRYISKAGVIAVIFMTVCVLPDHVAARRGAPGSTVSARQCVPSSGELRAGDTLSDRAGRYGLVLVEGEIGSPKRAVAGTLILHLRNQENDRSTGTSTPLYGNTDIDLRSAGAIRVGDPNSTDPEAPGVLVLETDRDGQRIIMLRIGSDANRKGLVRYDGAFTVLEVHRIDEDGFYGSWRSGHRSSRTRGHFCAIRES